ncbi:MAG: U32 family peptidase C-terminal domain-containing protein [Candidatus Moranbacteria bacterium]|nr:U32 family peptidase C-terminal domain-containing protein [Candidatus Moranbacteria bacterium]
MVKKIELVAPGGSLEKIEYAYHFGADAVYIGHPDFSLRARLNDFGEKNLKKAVDAARKLDKKIYFTLNIYAHQRHLAEIKKHLAFIKKIKPDAVIVSDPGILSLVKKHSPKIKIHLSTQANTTNSEAVKFWRLQGVSRIVLAREVTLEEIKKIRKACPKIELEYFVHGAMCMSLSGRCLLSSWMRYRSANLGDCVQPCRWKYKVQRAKCKAQNFGVPQSGTDILYADDSKIMTVEEDSHGTYFLNSKDLCLIEHLDKLAKAGINAFKIEGRTKSVFYAAVSTKAYRRVIDAIGSKKSEKELNKIIKAEKNELNKLTNRGYSTGFLFGKDKWENNSDCSHRENSYQFVGEIIGKNRKSWQKIKAHNALKTGEKVEIITPKNIFISRVEEIKNEKGESVGSAHGGSKNVCFVRLLGKFPQKSLLMKKLS